jgi:hypothetical protein
MLEFLGEPAHPRRWQLNPPIQVLDERPEQPSSAICASPLNMSAALYTGSNPLS